MDLSVDVVKVIVLLSLLVMTFVFGMLPVLFLRLINRTRGNLESEGEHAQGSGSVSRLAAYRKYISFLSCFSAGVFLATCLLDLLPTVRHNLIRVLFSVKVYTGFPVAEFIMVIGLFFILIVEQIVLTVKEHRPGTSHSHHSHGAPPDQTNVSDNVRQPLLSHSDPQLGNRDEMTESLHSDHSLGGISDQPHGLNSDDEDDDEDDWPQPVERRNHVQETLTQSSDGPNFRRQISTDRRLRRSGSHIANEHSLQTHSPLRAMLLVCALALHSVFEGLTIGLLRKMGDVLGIFAALALHKSILSFSLGMNLIQSRISVKSAIKSIILFSLSSPVGIGIGIGITDLWTSVSSGLLHGLLQGMASGTFLYIIFFEILPKEFNNDSDRLLKVLCLIVGYATVTGILFLSDDVKHPFCVINDKDLPT